MQLTTTVLTSNRTCIRKRVCNDVGSVQRVGAEMSASPDRTAGTSTRSCECLDRCGAPLIRNCGACPNVRRCHRRGCLLGWPRSHVPAWGAVGCGRVQNPSGLWQHLQRPFVPAAAIQLVFRGCRRGVLSRMSQDPALQFYWCGYVGTCGKATTIIDGAHTRNCQLCLFVIKRLLFLKRQQWQQPLATRHGQCTATARPPICR